MALPKVSYPTYLVELPSHKEPLTIRPFLVKEEKVLLMALQGGEVEEMVRAVKQIANNCVLSEKFDIEKLPLYELEYLFLQLRIKSVSDKLTLRFESRVGTECEECKKARTVVADLNTAKLEIDPEHNNKVDLGEGLGICMKYPDVRLLTAFDRINKNTSNGVEEYFRIIWKCVDYLYDADKIYSAKDESLEAGIEFLETLKAEQFAGIEKFFATLPKLRLDVDVKCTKCDFHEIYPIVGLENFFV